MATAPVAQVPSKPRREMHEVKAPELFSFNDENPWIGGVLRAMAMIELTDKQTGQVKEAMQYIIVTEEGQSYKLLATYDLTQKIGPEHVGHYVDIRYEGEDRSVRTQGNPLRKFRVQVSKEKEPGF